MHSRVPLALFGAGRLYSQQQQFTQKSFAENCAAAQMDAVTSA
jgi:hypothetical protein